MSTDARISTEPPLSVLSGTQRFSRASTPCRSTETDRRLGLLGSSDSLSMLLQRAIEHVDARCSGATVETALQRARPSSWGCGSRVSAFGRFFLRVALRV